MEVHGLRRSISDCNGRTVRTAHCRMRVPNALRFFDEASAYARRVDDLFARGMPVRQMFRTR